MKDKNMEATKYDIVTKENLKHMVLTFYTKVINEEGEVTTVFKDKLGDDLSSDTWQEHLVTITNFWAMLVLDDKEYQGRPMRPHFALPLNREMFGEWLRMFFETVDVLYEPSVGQIIKTKAQNMASNFMNRLNL